MSYSFSQPESESWWRILERTVEQFVKPYQMISVSIDYDSVTQKIYIRMDSYEHHSEVTINRKNISDTPKIAADIWWAILDGLYGGIERQRENSQKLQLDE